jgi:ABC-type multidrug transport system fused ATPase/permease subunit
MKDSKKNEKKNTAAENLRIIRRILHYLRKYIFFLIAAFVFAGISSMLALYIPVLTGDAVDLIVKKGNVDIDASDYEGLAGEVYLLTTNGVVHNGDKYGNVYTVDPAEIFSFACEGKNQRFLPEKIRTWIGFLSSKKGIIFDTNLSYSDDNED